MRAAAREHLARRVVFSIAMVLVLVPPAPGADERRDAARLAAEAAQKAAEAEFARYERLTVTWVRSAAARDVRAVFPHPVVARRVALAAGEGLLLSDDTGATWRALAAAATEKLGEVRHVAWQPDRPDAFYLATAGKGVWLTEDAGRTFRQVGSRRSGLASDAVERVSVWPADPRFRTLHAFHGRQAAGISRSYNGGAAWTVVADGYYVRRVFPPIKGWGGIARMLIVASAKAAPQMETIYSASSLEDLWGEVLRDVVYADGTMALFGEHVYVATADGGLLRVSEAGATPIGPPNVARYASVGATWGPRADKELTYAYEPRRLGLVTSLDGMSTCTADARGLYVGPFVKEGAHVRANANGRTFFAAVNGSLYKGYVRTRGLSITEAMIDPPVFTYDRTAYEEAAMKFREELRGFGRRASAAAAARDLLARRAEVDKAFAGGDLRITARLIGAQREPRSVTVDLSSLQGPADEAMYDDGRHGDGQPGDGVYGARFQITPRNLRNPRRGEQVAAGVHGLSIKVTAEDNSIRGAVAVFAVYGRPEDLVFWAEGRFNPLRADSDSGEVTLVASPPRWEALEGDACMKLQTHGRPWSAAVGSQREPKDVAGYYALSFWVRCDGGAELNVQLRDAPEFDYETTTAPVAIVKERLVEGGELADRYRRVVIPMSRLLRGAERFRPARLGWVVFSGDGKPPATFWIDRLVFHVNAESLANDTKPAPGSDDERRRRRE